MEQHNGRGPLTPTRDALRRWWLDYHRQTGYWPTIREAGLALERDEASVHGTLRRLESDGWAYRIAGRYITRSWAMRPDEG
jgi:hypothetical protein